jgi:hypothetical protein
MSTAGKVLVCLVMLASFAWIALTAGVTQLNRNGNAALKKLVDDLKSAKENLASTKQEIFRIKDAITVQQEKTDREIARLRASQADIEKARSQTQEVVAEVQVGLATIQNTLKNAEISRQQRTTENKAEEQALEEAHTELAALKANNTELMDLLADLRQQFEAKYQDNLELISHKK